jgi:hypothetical protein
MLVVKGGRRRLAGSGFGQGATGLARSKGIEEIKRAKAGSKRTTKGYAERRRESEGGGGVGEEGSMNDQKRTRMRRGPRRRWWALY